MPASGPPTHLVKLVAPDDQLLVREPEDYYDKAEIVIDPFKLSVVRIAARLRPD